VSATHMRSPLLPPRNATGFAAWFAAEDHVQQGLSCQGGLMLSLYKLDGAQGKAAILPRGWAPTRTLGAMRISRALCPAPHVVPYIRRQPHSPARPSKVIHNTSLSVVSGCADTEIPPRMRKRPGAPSAGGPLRFRPRRLSPRAGDQAGEMGPELRHAHGERRLFWCGVQVLARALCAQGKGNKQNRLSCGPPPWRAQQAHSRSPPLREGGWDRVSSSTR
jgi:hypothetical protein